MAKKEIKDGWKYLLKQGKGFKIFLLMVCYFLFLDILSIFGVINGFWVLILSLPAVVIILIAYFIYAGKRGGDEMK